MHADDDRPPPGTPSVPGPPRADRLRVGDRLPDVALVDHDGRPWHTGDQLGRPLVLVLHRHLA